MATPKKPMTGRYKKFDQDLFVENNDRAINAVLEHINSTGLFAEVNDDRYGPDIVVYKGFRPAYFIEVDLVRGWKTGTSKWPFKNVHVPERKAKFINLRAHKSLEFWSLSSDLTFAVVATDQIVSSSPLSEVANTQIVSGELFYCVDLDNTSLVELRREATTNDRQED